MWASGFPSWPGTWRQAVSTDRAGKRVDCSSSCARARSLSRANLFLFSREGLGSSSGTGENKTIAIFRKEIKGSVKTPGFINLWQAEAVVEICSHIASLTEQPLWFSSFQPWPRTHGVSGPHALSSGHLCRHCRGRGWGIIYRLELATEHLETSIKWIPNPPPNIGKGRAYRGVYEQNKINKAHSRPQEPRSTPGNGCFTHCTKLWRPRGP